jgi:hypothetical protein
MADEKHEHDHGTGFIWVCTHIVGPLIAIVSILAWRWITGAPMLPRLARGSTFLHGAAKPDGARVAWGHWPGYQRAITRLVATTVVITGLLWPIATAATIVTAIVGLGSAVAIVRLRAHRATGPRVVKAVRAQPEQPTTWTNMQRETTTCAR